ncbi:hypothetical protein IGK74_002328 [Enterococcus sp. AZ150]|uniref:hypothetical protein n=1 Tax=Enterococcus sp. AZ150 TaxID=2774866 RepID=UPI003F27CFD7
MSKREAAIILQDMIRLSNCIIYDNYKFDPLADIGEYDKKNQQFEKKVSELVDKKGNLYDPKYYEIIERIREFYVKYTSVLYEGTGSVSDKDYAEKILHEYIIACTKAGFSDNEIVDFLSQYEDQRIAVSSVRRLKAKLLNFLPEENFIFEYSLTDDRHYKEFHNHIPNIDQVSFFTLEEERKNKHE